MYLTYLLLPTTQGVPAAHMYLSSIVGRVVASGAFLLATALLRCYLVITPIPSFSPPHCSGMQPYVIGAATLSDRGAFLFLLSRLLTHVPAQLRRCAHPTAHLHRRCHRTLGGTDGLGSLSLTLSLTITLNLNQTRPTPNPDPNPHSPGLGGLPRALRLR